MGLRMRKSFTLCKGVKLNLGKKGASISVGTRGLRYTIHSSGKRTSSVGIPGTGISYISSSRGNSSKRSYSSKAYINRQKLQAERQQAKLDEIRNNELIVREYEALINSIKSIHKECDDIIDWSEVCNRKPPFIFGEIGPNQKLAIEALNTYKPNFFEKIFKSLQNKKMSQLEENISIASNIDSEEYFEWERLRDISKRILDGDIETYFEIINDMNPLDDLLEFGSDFEFSAETKEMLEIEFRVKSDITVPTFSMNLTQTGKLSKKNLSKTAYYDLVQDYVCSCAIRIARDMFALLPLDTVIVHAVDSVINSEDGHLREVTILSVSFDKNKLATLNFEKLDPSDSMNLFNCNMKFLKTSGFKPVVRI